MSTVELWGHPKTLRCGHNAGERLVCIIVEAVPGKMLVEITPAEARLMAQSLLEQAAKAEGELI